MKKAIFRQPRSAPLFFIYRQTWQGTLSLWLATIIINNNLATKEK